MNEWRRVRLGRICEINPPTPDFVSLDKSDQVTFLPLEAIWADSLDTSRERPKHEVETGYTRFREGDVLVPKITPTFEASRSAVARNLRGGVGCGTTELHVLRPRRDLDARFLFHVTHSRRFLQEGAGAMQGVAGQKRVPEAVVSNYSIDLPSLEVQRSVADFLDRETIRIDETVAAKRRLALLLTERMDSIRATWIQDCFARFGQISLRRTARQIEQGWSPITDNVPAEPWEWGILKTSAATAESFRPEENKRLPESVDPDPRWIVRDGDLLVTRGSGSLSKVGRAAVANTAGRRLLLPDLLYRVHLARGTASFVANVLSSPPLRSLVEACVRTDAGQTLKIRRDDLAAFPIPGADPAQQPALVRALEETLRPHLHAAVALERQVRLLAEHRQALITAATFGQVDVSEGAA